MQPRTASGAAGQLPAAATRSAAVRAGKSIRYFSRALGGVAAFRYPVVSPTELTLGCSRHLPRI